MNIIATQHLIFILCAICMRKMLCCETIRSIQNTSELKPLNMFYKIYNCHWVLNLGFNKGKGEGARQRPLDNGGGKWALWWGVGLLHVEFMKPGH